MRFPIPRGQAYSYAQRYGVHQGTDIMAEEGTPVVAVEDGTAHAALDPKGGVVVYLSTSAGARYYYAHLSRVVAPLDPEDRQIRLEVRAGDQLGAVGSTGNAAGGAPHLHFQLDRGAGWVDPYPWLRAADPNATGGRGATLSLTALLLAVAALMMWAGTR